MRADDFNDVVELACEATGMSYRGWNVLASPGNKQLRCVLMSSNWPMDNPAVSNFRRRQSAKGELRLLAATSESSIISKQPVGVMGQRLNGKSRINPDPGPLCLLLHGSWSTVYGLALWERLCNGLHLCFG